MANNFQGIQSGLATLKNYYEGPIVSQFNDEVPLYRGMEKGKEKWNGLQVVRPIKVVRNPGIGSTSDGGLLPAIGRQTTVQALIAAKFNYLRFGVTGPMLKASQGDKGAFVSAMEFEMTEGLIDFKNDVNRQLFWDGTGTIAVVAANAVASNVITVNGRSTGEAGNKYIDVGTVIDVVNGTTGVYSAQGITVNSATNAATSTLVLSQAVSVNANDLVVRSGSYLNDIQGIRTQLDGGTSTVFNIPRATYAQTQGNVLDNLGAQMSLQALENTLNLARRRGGGKISAIYSDFVSEAMYNKLLVADKRYLDKKEGDNTFSDKDKTYLQYAGAPWVADKDCTQDVYFLMEGCYKKYVLAELEWADETGSYMIAQISADAFEARLRFFANIFNEKPAANARFTDYISP